MLSQRTIFHVDMDAFFVSVEELFDPALKGKAVVVGGQRDERGVVSAASYEARKFGVHSAMPLRTAAKLCPQAIFVNGHPERYRECSENVYRVLTSFSPLVEMASIDEAYLDMTRNCTPSWPAPVRCPFASPEDQDQYAFELFHRHRRLPPDRKSLLRQGQAAWNPLGRSRTGSEVSRPARRA